jgi:hypothetical protein
MKVKDISSSAKKFVSRGQAASGDYARGVADAGPEWASKTAAAQDSYNQGVQQAITRGAFAKGVQEAGPAKYQAAAAGKGAQRFGPGIAAAEGDWSRGVQPYLQTLESTTLPPRGPKGSPQNLERVNTVAMALRRRKTGGA